MQGQQKELSRNQLLLMAVTTGLVIANNYYNQPLLEDMAETLKVSQRQISIVPMLTQVGFAVGLLLIVPLGDKLSRKRLVLVNFIFTIAALLAASRSETPLQLKTASFFIGLTSVVPQIMVPMAAQLATAEKRGAAIGTVMTGMLTGVLGSRVLSGFAGHYLGWQAVFLMAAGFMVVLALILKAFLPDIKPDFSGSYGKLLGSILEQFRTQPRLRLAGLRGALNFAGFSVFWTTLVFLLAAPPFHMGSDVAGLFGLVGVAGALIAVVVGKLSDRMSKNTLISIATLVIMGSWVIMGFPASGIAGLILGAFFLDLGIQSVHITNQTIIFEGNPSGRNRINTVYMVMSFAGGAFGTFIAALVWEYFKWPGVSIAGFSFGVLTLLVNLTWRE